MGRSVSDDGRYGKRGAKRKTFRGFDAAVTGKEARGAIKQKPLPYVTQTRTRNGLCGGKKKIACQQIGFQAVVVTVVQSVRMVKSHPLHVMPCHAAPCRPPIVGQTRICDRHTRLWRITFCSPHRSQEANRGPGEKQTKKMKKGHRARNPRGCKSPIRAPPRRPKGPAKRYNNPQQGSSPPDHIAPA